MNLSYWRALPAALSLLLAPAVTLAVPTLPGDTELVPGTTAAASPELAGTVIYDDTSQFYALDPTPLIYGDGAGHVYQDRVVRSDVTGNVIITPRLRDPYNVTVFDMYIEGFSLTGYAGWATDVTYRTDGDGDIGPTLVERSADGDELSFTFGFPLLLGNLLGEPHQESLFISILTDAPAFETTGRATFFGHSESDPTQVLTFSIGGLAVPAAAQVSVPSPLALLIGGALLLAARPRHRRQVTSKTRMSISPSPPIWPYARRNEPFLNRD